MTEDPNLDDVMARLQRGDEQTATDVFRRFATRLIELARSRLDRDLQRKVDPEDIVQSAFHSFFRRNEAGEIAVANWDSLWSLLAVITIHKCGHRILYHRAARRAAGREMCPLQVSGESSAEWEAIAKDPSPSHAIMLTEAIDELMKSLGEREQQILMLSLQGYTVKEVSKMVERSQRTVTRVLESVRAKLEDRCERDG